jgi:hypothetical protein
MKTFSSLWESAKGVMNNIISNALWELIRALFIPIISTSLLLYSSTPFVIAISISVLSSISLVVLIFKYRNVDFRYMFLEKKIYFEYKESYSIYNTSHKVRALTNNVDRFYGRYTWDYNKVDMTCIAPSNSTIIPHPINDAYQKYDVYFGGRKYNIGDPFEVKLESTMHGELQFPLFATTVIKPTNLLLIHIKLPLQLLKSNTIRLVTSPTPAEVGISRTEDVKLDNNGEYVWKISHPNLTYEYAIEWDFIDEKQALFKSK